MPSLEVTRNWLRGDETKGLPVPPKKSGEAARTSKAAEEDSVTEVAAKKQSKFEEGLARHRAKKGSARRGLPAPRTSSTRYELHVTRDDATLHFGHHKGKTVSAIAATEEGCRYLRWMLAQDFPGDLLEIVSLHFKEGKR